GKIDDELLDGACMIVTALISAGPAEHLEDYEGGVPAIQRLLEHLQTRCNNVQRLHTVTEIRRWITEEKDPQVWDRREEQLGWTEEVRHAIVTRCDAIIKREIWP